MKISRVFLNPLVILIVLIMGVYWQFFIQGKIPVPTDTLVGAYFPWLDYKWGYSVGVPVKNPIISDVFSQFFIWKYLTIDYIKQGIWPLWNPYSFSGIPLLATYHSATLLPFNVLLLLPRYFGWGIYIFGQTAIAALGMYFLLGKYIKNSSARIAGSLVFSLAGPMTTWAEFGTGVWAASMLPWIFYSLESFIQFKKIRYLILLTLSFATLFLSGHAQLTFYSSVLFGAYLTFQFINKKISLKEFIYLIIFYSLSIGISLIQFLPTLDLTKISVRSGEAYSRQFSFGLSPVYELVRLFASDFFGHPSTYNHWDKLTYHEYSSFLGTLTIPLILPLILKRFRTSLLNFWGIVFIITIILAIQNPLSELLYSFPIPLLTYSSASRIFFVTSFAAGILIAFGVDRYSLDKLYQDLTRKSVLAALAVFVGLAIGLIATVLFLRSYQNMSDAVGLTANLKISLKNIIFPFAILILLFIVTFFRKNTRLAVYLIIFVIFFDLGRYFLKYNPFVDQKLIFPTTPIINFVQNDQSLFRISRADPEIMPPNTWTFYKLNSIEGYDPMALESYSRLFNKVNGAPFEGNISRYVEAKNFQPNYINALNVKYLLAVKRDAKGVIPGNLLNYRLREMDYKPIFEDKTSVVLENPHVKDRAYFIEKVTEVTSSDKFIEKINSPQFNPVSEVIIQGDVDRVTTYKTDGIIKINEYKSNRINFSTDIKESGFLVFADSFEKNWKLSQNGQQAILYQVNGALRGIKVSAGKTEFQMTYQPTSFDLGLKLSIASLLLVIFISLFTVQRKVFKL